ncbi:MAG: ArsI/CadI family heavy metal resistance metalloenzyme [Woeseiaceae bacterium]
MKRMHVHVNVDDINTSIQFYSTLFDAEPAVNKPDYAKWMLEDPRINFAISAHGRTPGVDHLGIEADNLEELAGVHELLTRTDGPSYDENEVTCCYASSKKKWVQDPQGVAWETFHTHGTATVYGDDFRDEAAKHNG